MSKEPLESASSEADSKTSDWSSGPGGSIQLQPPRFVPLDELHRKGALAALATLIGPVLEEMAAHNAKT